MEPTIEGEILIFRFFAFRIYTASLICLFCSGSPPVHRTQVPELYRDAECTQFIIADPDAWYTLALNGHWWKMPNAAEIRAFVDATGRVMSDADKQTVVGDLDYPSTTKANYGLRY